MEWNTKNIVIFCIPIALVIFGLVAWLFLSRTMRTRIRMEKQLRDDPDTDEWLVIFGWTRKILYIPTIAASLIAAAVMVLVPTESISSSVVGGVWLAIFFINLMIEEFELSLKILLIFILCLLLLVLWLASLDLLVPFVRQFRHLGIQINATGYLIIALLFLLTIVVSYLRGLFYYVAITPNCLYTQVGPTETGEQIARETYSTRIDTGDFMERLMGFGRIIITFSDQQRLPMTLLVGRIGAKAKRLESARGTLSVDRRVVGGSGAT